MNNILEVLLILIILTTLSIFLLKLYQKNKEKLIKEQKEDILKLIYKHSLQNENINFENLQFRIKTKELQKILDALLKERKIKYEKNNIKLTQEGINQAKEIVEKHRNIEKHLFENTSTNLEDIHSIAEKQEHEELKEIKENTSKSYNCIDPHGDLIKGENLPSFPLSQLIGEMSFVSKLFKIIHVEDEPAEIYKKIISMDLAPFDYIKIKNISSSTIEILTNKGQLLEIDFITSQNIHVTSIEDKQISEFFENLEKCLTSITTLDKLQINQKAIIIGISFYVRGEERRRLLELGFVKNSLIQPLYNNMLGTDPRVYKIKNTTIALRKEQAQKIYVLKQ
ncbi:MAG: DtxR family transcriptional regulator [bacterium]